MKGIKPDTEPIGESWEVSAISGDESIVENGPLKGTSINELCRNYGADFLGPRIMTDHNGHFPLLIKFIDAQQNLSIQVHPDDATAMQRHGKLGKTEMWYVIHAEPGAYLYAGFKQNVSKAEYKERVANGTITDVLARHEVCSGDVFFLPAGRVHAIGSGILLAEVQQSSDVTYRIFDYNRLGLDGKPRELHTELAVDIVDREVHPEYRTFYTPLDGASIPLVRCAYFSTNVLEMTATVHRDLIDIQSFVVYMCMDGSCLLRSTKSNVEVELQAGNTCLVPAAVADVEIVPTSDLEKTRLLEVYVE